VICCAKWGGILSLQTPNPCHLVKCITQNRTSQNAVVALCAGRDKCSQGKEEVWRQADVR